MPSAKSGLPASEGSCRSSRLSTPRVRTVGRHTFPRTARCRRSEDRRELHAVPSVRVHANGTAWSFIRRCHGWSSSFCPLPNKTSRSARDHPKSPRCRRCSRRAPRLDGEAARFGGQEHLRAAADGVVTRANQDLATPSDVRCTTLVGAPTHHAGGVRGAFSKSNVQGGASITEPRGPVIVPTVA